MNTEALARIHQPAHALALEHARDHLRRACSALAAAYLPDRQQRDELSRMHSRLRDELVALETIAQWPSRT